MSHCDGTDPPVDTLAELTDAEPALYGRFMDAALALQRGEPIVCPRCCGSFARHDDWLDHLDQDGACST